MKVPFTEFDRYTLNARIAPYFIPWLPALLSFLAWFPLEEGGWDTIAALVIAFGLIGLMGQLGRDAGRSKQIALSKKWGGLPTTILLRYRTSWVGRPTLDRYKNKLRELCPGVHWPSEQDEEQAPDKADESYVAWVRFLRAVTHDSSRFPLVLAESINFGFRRNLWALKPYGIGLSLFGVIASATRVWMDASNMATPSPVAVLGVAISMGLFYLWIFRVNPRWVRVVANAYAERLLECCDQL